MRKTYKNLKIFALSAMMALTGCGLDSSNDVAFNENQNSFTDESSEKISTNKKIPGVGVKTIDDQKYDEDTNSVDSNYIDDTEFVVTTMPLESGTSTTVYTTVVGDNDFTESVGGKSETKASKTGTNNGGSSTRTNTPQTDNRKPNVTTAASKSTKKETTTTAKPIVTTITSVSTQPTQPPMPPQTSATESQPAIEPPAPREYTIDDICNDINAFQHYSGQLAEQLTGRDGFFYGDVYVYGHLVNGYPVGQYLLAAVNYNGDHSCISDEILAEIFGIGDLEQQINDGMGFLNDFKRIQNESGRFVDFSSFVCSEKNGDGSYSNHLNTMQSYSNNILDYAANKDNYSYDFVSNALFYAYQRGIDDSLRFITFEEVLNSSQSFNDHLRDVVYNKSFSK